MFNVFKKMVHFIIDIFPNNILFSKINDNPVKDIEYALGDMLDDGILTEEEDIQLTRYAQLLGVEKEYDSMRVKLFYKEVKPILDNIKNKDIFTNSDEETLLKIGKKYLISPTFDNLKSNVTITSSLALTPMTHEAKIIDNNKISNSLNIKLTSKVFALTTDSSDLLSLNDDENFIHGDRVVKNQLWLYLYKLNQYDPHNFDNLKDALIARNRASEQAYKKLYEVFPNGSSYRVVEEVDKINEEITKYIRTIHPFYISDFVNTNIDNVIRATRNYTRYVRVIKYIEKDEVDEIIGAYIEYSIDRLVEKIKPLELEEKIVKELRPLIIDALSVFDLKKRPSRWKRENFSTQVAIKLFKGHEVIQQGSPKFLGRQRYDIWIPSLNIAIEYNGRQHYEYVSFFHTNGLKDFKKQQERDMLKRSISINNNVVLIEIPYYTKDIKYFLENKLNEYSIDITPSSI